MYTPVVYSNGYLIPHSLRRLSIILIIRKVSQ